MAIVGFGAQLLQQEIRQSTAIGSYWAMAPLLHDAKKPFLELFQYMSPSPSPNPTSKFCLTWRLTELMKLQFNPLAFFCCLGLFWESWSLLQVSSLSYKIVPADVTWLSEFKSFYSRCFQFSLLIVPRLYGDSSPGNNRLCLSQHLPSSPFPPRLKQTKQTVWRRGEGHEHSFSIGILGWWTKFLNSWLAPQLRSALLPPVG